MDKVKMPKLPKKEMPVFSDDHIPLLLAACDAHRDRAIVMFLLDSGIRSIELLALNVEDVDLTRGGVFIKRGKGRKERTAYVSVRTLKQLLRYFAERGELQPHDPVWASTKGGRFTKSGLVQFMRRLGTRSQVKHCKAHTFRRYWAVKSLKNGMSVFHLQRLGGWENMETMRRYMVLVEVDLEAAHREFGVIESLHRR